MKRTPAFCPLSPALKLFQETEGYSGSDIKLVCREAAMRPVRKIFSVLENNQSGMAGLTVLGPWAGTLCLSILTLGRIRCCMLDFLAT
jgi:SpoVK/Ycf46/Vps4 family AAA+-type ATPase